MSVNIAAVKTQSATTLPQQHNKQVCVQLPTYADHVALPAFARHCCWAPAVQQLINQCLRFVLRLWHTINLFMMIWYNDDISCKPGSQQQTCSSGFAAVGPGWTQTDGRRTVTQSLHRSASEVTTLWRYTNLLIIIIIIIMQAVPTISLLQCHVSPFVYSFYMALEAVRSDNIQCNTPGTK